MQFNCAYTELVSVSKLVPNPKNANKHSTEQIERLAKIIDFQGQRSPIVVSKRSGFITKGHGRLMAMQKLGWENVAVDYQDYLSEAQEYADVIADNEIARWAELDREMLNLEIKNLDIDLDLLGILDFKIEPLIEVLEPQSDEDEVPEVVNPISKRGDIWLLGNHRLMCGDSTMIDDFEKLMNGERSEITFTSPPYNAGATPKENGKYLNNTDNLSCESYLDFLNTFTTNCLMYSDYVFSNIQSLSGNKVALIEHLYDMKDSYADTMIWNKGFAQPAMARRVLNSSYEYVHIFSKEANRAIGKKDFRGTISNIFELNSKSGKEYASVHKATFRVELPQMFLENFSEVSCLDPFNGTGTTLIACEKLGRKYFGMELEPTYVDITIARWEKFTGKKATLESTGESYEELSISRKSI